MPHAARLTSIDTVQVMAAAVESFRAEAASALDDLEMEIRRAVEWIHHNRKEHWSHEVRRGWERVSETRVQLQQAQTFRRIAEHEPSCIDEKKALEKAKRRLDVAQQKIEAVRHWSVVIDRAVNEYRAGRAQLGNWLDAEVPKALAALERMADALEAYVALEAPSGPYSSPLPPGEGRGEGEAVKGEGAESPLAASQAPSQPGGPTP